MPLISQIEGKSLRGKLIYGAIILVLCIGSVTMVYPFLIMISGSLRSQMDINNLSIIPAYLVDNKPLVRKFLEAKYNGKIISYNQNERQNAFQFATASVPEKVFKKRVLDFKQFCADYPIPYYWWNLGAIDGYKVVLSNLRKMRSQLNTRFDGNLRALSENLGAPVSNWGQVKFTPPKWLSQQFNYHKNAMYDVYFKMLKQSPLAERIILSVSGYFVKTELKPIYGNVKIYNKANNTNISSFSSFILPRTVPDKNHTELRKLWLDYVRNVLNPAFVTMVGISNQQYQNYIQKRYKNNLNKLNTAWHTQLSGFKHIALPHHQWMLGSQGQDYLEFIKTLAPSHYRIDGPEYAWRNWLKKQYNGNIDVLNNAYHTDYTSFADAHIPMAQLEYEYVLNNSQTLRWTYATRNYVNVIDAMVLQGRALVNTVIFCALSILIALLVNPLAAYAMSRFKLPGTYKILLILMCTMAFPPMVTLIPTFIMLRDLSLLNTFAALVLPTAANGYLIFLLKGFFDSLPQELYEAARIDGASELRMFFQITMALSKPILAWIVIISFNSAYVAFLYPLIVAPDPNMWLISVWLFQYQQNSLSSAVYASIVIASIPTFLVFLFAQRTIMRGIVIPVEK